MSVLGVSGASWSSGGAWKPSVGRMGWAVIEAALRAAQVGFRAATVACACGLSWRLHLRRAAPSCVALAFRTPAFSGGEVGTSASRSNE